MYIRKSCIYSTYFSKAEHKYSIYQSIYITVIFVYIRVVYIRRILWIQNITTLCALEASWSWGFDPCTPLLYDLYHYSELNYYFGLVPDHAPGPSSQDRPGCRVRHQLDSQKLFVRDQSKYFRVVFI